MEKNAPVWTLTRDTFCNGFQVQRIKARGYSMWIDIEKRQGSTAEGMADAVEGAAVMCYGISQAYKESLNCRLEAQYAYQQQLDMVPRVGLGCCWGQRRSFGIICMYRLCSNTSRVDMVHTIMVSYYSLYIIYIYIYIYKYII